MFDFTDFKFWLWNVELDFTDWVSLTFDCVSGFGWGGFFSS